MKQILVINGHPDKLSFNYALSEAYKAGAKNSKAQVSQINISELNFDPNLKYGYRERSDLEPDLVNAIEKIKGADHLVWIFPMWWFGYPALMKGFIDRTFLPGLTYEFVKGKSTPIGLLKGKTARIIMTADSPAWYNNLIMRNPAIRQFKKGTLEYCGVKSIKVTYLGPVSSSNSLKRTTWLQRVRKIGQNLA